MGADSDHWHTEPTEEETLLFPLQFDFATGHDLSLAEAAASIIFVATNVLGGWNRLVVLSGKLH